MNFSLKKSRSALILLPIVLAILPIAAVFYEEKPIPYLIILLLILFFLEKDKKENFRLYRPYLKPYLIIISVYIIYTVFAIKIIPALKILERQVSLLLIPLIVFASQLSKDRLRMFFKTFLMSMSMISIFSIFLLLWFLEEHAEWIKIMNQTNQSQTYLQFKFPHLIGAHPTYWTYLLVLANIILLSNKSLNLRLKKKWVLILLILFNINIFYLSARTPMLINILIHLMAFIIAVRHSKTSRFKIFGIILGIAMIGIVAIRMPLLIAKFSNISKDERVFLWPRAIEQIKKNCYILGEGLGQGRAILKKYIIENGDPRINYKGFDLHNQYLNHYMEMGLLGLLALVYLITYPIFISKGQLNFLALPLIGLSILFSISLLTEASLYYIKGIVIFSVFSSILIKTYKAFYLAKEK